MATYHSSSSEARSWPALRYESLPWKPRAGTTGRSRRERLSQRTEYEAAIPPSIETVDLALPADVVAEAGEAATEIARFDSELGSELAPFASILLRSESAASSRIENLTASARSVALADIGDKSRENATLIVANTAAMRAAIKLAGELDAATILAMHAALMSGDPHHEAGQWRQEQVWIGGSDFGPYGADFVAPHHDRVRACIDDLVRYMHRNDVAVLPQAAVAHAQFETIHPFTDGNGRTGRALMHALLRNKELTRSVTVPVSAGLLARTAEYYAALTAFRTGDPAPIVSLTARASFSAIANGRALVDEIRDIRASWDDKITVRKQSRTWEVADLLTRQPIVNARTLKQELGIAPGHVRRHMDVLELAGIVRIATLHQRGVYWRADEILVALDDFAERAGRRGPGSESGPGGTH